MDLNTITSALLSGDSIRSISRASGATQKDVKAVLAAALPDLLQGAAGQANNSQTAAGFAGALAQHAKSDTRDLGSFLSNVDLADGGKIIAHLLGANTGAATQQAASASGVDPAKVARILAVAAPLLMSLLGQQANQSSSPVGALLNGLLGGGNGANLLGTLLGVTTPQTTTTAKKKKTSTAKKPAASTAKKPASSSGKKTSSTAKKTTTAKKPAASAKKTTTAKKKPAAKSNEAALLDTLVGLLK